VGYGIGDMRRGWGVGGGVWWVGGVERWGFVGVGEREGYGGWGSGGYRVWVWDGDSENHDGERKQGLSGMLN
jgi:hypothetical protein